MLRLIKRNPKLFIPDARKVKTSHSSVKKVENAAGYSSFKVIITPNRDEEQETSSMDDETNVKTDFKAKKLLKFSEKYMVWKAICSWGAKYS